MSKAIAGALGFLALAACASQNLTTQHLAESMAAVRSAKTAGAAQVPQAALHLQLAQEQISRAQKLSEDDEERSDALALRAYNDADLALALTREAQSKQQLASFAEAHPSIASSFSAESSSNTSQPSIGAPNARPSNSETVTP